MLTSARVAGALNFLCALALSLSRGLAACLMAGHFAPAQAQPSVKLSDWEPDRNGTGVRFVALQTLTETNPSEISLSDQTVEGTFQYGFTPSEVRWGDECRCFRYYVVNVRSASSGVVTRHKFKAIPSGTFPDQFVPIRITIKEGEKTDIDTINVPVGSAPGVQPTVIDVTTHKPLEAVWLSGISEVQVTLKNVGKMAVTVQRLFVEPEQKDLWKEKPTFEGGATPFELPPQTAKVLNLTLKPQTGRAIGISWPPTENTQRHTAFAVGAAYENPFFQNRSAETSLSVPIRFQPNLLSLAVALVIGVVLGSLVLLLTKQATGAPWLRGIATALVVGLILELVGMFLVANASKFVVFGYNLDPWQSVPVASRSGRGGSGIEVGRTTRENFQEIAMLANQLSAVAFSAVLACVGVRASFGQAASQAQQRPPFSRFAGDGPVAISMRDDTQAAVLQLKGRVSSFDVRRWASNGELFTVPPEFDASDLVAASTPLGEIICVLLNGQAGGGRGSYVVHLFGGQKVWTSLTTQGVYTGVTIDPNRRVAYVANSTNNGVFRLRLGEEKQSIEYVTTLHDATRIGAIVLDPVGQRLFVGDSDGHRIFVRDLNTRRTQSIEAEDMSEIRAMVWDTGRKRLYVADSANEGIWSVDPQGGQAVLLLRDRRFREPSGLTMIGPDVLGVTDEKTGAVWSFSLSERVVKQTAVLGIDLKK